MMEYAAQAVGSVTHPKDRLIIALDVPTAIDARSIISELQGAVGAFKIGLQLFTSAGSDFVREVVNSGIKVFLDLKFHDIPNTVAQAAVEAAKLGVWMMNVHAAGGRVMMERTRAEVRSACERDGLAVPILIAVTVLTSSDSETLREGGVERGLDEQVAALADLTSKAGLDGVVASPHEVALIRKTVRDEHFIVVTPGIRPISATDDDQRRVMTFGQALAAGSDYVVVGRPITRAADRLAAVREMLAGE